MPLLSCACVSFNDHIIFDFIIRGFRNTADRSYPVLNTGSSTPANPVFADKLCLQKQASADRIGRYSQQPVSGQNLKIKNIFLEQIPAADNAGFCPTSSSSVWGDFLPKRSAFQRDKWSFLTADSSGKRSSEWGFLTGTVSGNKEKGFEESRCRCNK